MPATNLNYHHLHYFWAVAKDGNLTRAARLLHVSQSALSAQIRHLEEQLGVPLFKREGRGLRLTEAGQIAMMYAERIFSSGEELVATLREGRQRDPVLRIGAVSTLSRNFQESVIKPLLTQSSTKLRLVAGRIDDLLARLADHTLDLVLSTRPVQGDAVGAWRCHRVARQKVSLVGRPRAEAFRFPQDLAVVSMILPGIDSNLRTGFDVLCEGLGIEVHVLAEVDDMAMMRLLARDTEAVALIPSVVARDELQSGVLQEYCVVPDLYEDFYAITVTRQYPHPLLKVILRRDGDEILAMPNSAASTSL